VTRRWSARAGLITALACSALVAAGPALAAGAQGDLLGVTTTDGRSIDILFAAAEDTDNLEIEQSSVRVTMQRAGAPAVDVPPTSVGSGETSPTSPSSTSMPDRAVMLAIDTSASMDTNNYFKAAQSAAKEFAHSLPADVPVGIVTFGDPARLVLPPTSDRARVDRAIDKLSTSGDTAMYEAVTIAVKAMGTTAVRSIVMLTDGRNEDLTPPTFMASDARAALKQVKDRSPVDFAGILVGNQDRGSIDKIAGKSVVQQRTDTRDLQRQLSAFFAKRTTNIVRQVRISVPVPVALAGTTVTLRVSARTADGQEVSAAGLTVLPKVAVAPTGQAGPVIAAPDRRLTAVTTPVALGALGALFLAVAVFVFIATGAVTGSSEPESQVVRRLSMYTLTSAKPQQIAITEQTTRLGDSALARSAVGLMSRLARTGQLERALDSRLEAAGLPLRTAEWMLLHVGSAVGASLLLLVIGRGAVIPMIVGLVLGLAVPWLALSFLRSRRESRFLSQLPDTLQLLAGSLAAGYSLPQAMDSVVREGDPPISVEFNRALIEARLGMLPEDALDGIAARTASKDFSWIVLAIRIQRDVGGNLAELLSSVAETLRERERLRRQVRALSAEGKLSGIILGALPIVFALYLVLVRPDYIGPLFKTPIGLLLLAFGAVMLLVGGLWMAKVIKVDV
jgi:tight adherence protein B